MSPFEEFLLVLAALYAIACCGWLRREACLFRTSFTRRFVLVPGRAFLGSDLAGAYLLNPLPPLGRAFIAWLPFASLGKEGVLTAAASAHNPGERVPRERRFVAWSELGRVSSDGARVLAGGRELLRAGTSAHAAQLTRVVEAVRVAPDTLRAHEIDRALANSLDVARARERVASFEMATTALRVACIGELLMLAGVLPALGFTVGLGVSWPWFLSSLGVAHAVVLVCAWRAHARLYADMRSERGAWILSLALMPTATVRALDVLGRDLLVDLHPLAAARALLDDAAFATCAERMLRDAFHPLPFETPIDDERARRVDAWWRERLARELTRCAVENGITTEIWNAPPARLAIDCAAFCPRCTRQYTHDGGECSACAAVALVPFMR